MSVRVVIIVEVVVIALLAGAIWWVTRESAEEHTESVVPLPTLGGGSFFFETQEGTPEEDWCGPVQADLRTRIAVDLRSLRSTML